MDITGVIFLYPRQDEVVVDIRKNEQLYPRQDEVGVYINKNELLYPRRQLSVKISIDDQKNID